MKKTTHKNGILIKAYGASDVGQRTSNEDAYLIDEGIGLFIVADGMGGHAKGEVASWFTSEKLMEIIASLPSNKEDATWLPEMPPELSGERPENVLEYAILAINKKLHRLNEEGAEAEVAKTADPVGKEIAKTIAAKKRMGTTIVSLFILGDRAYLTHIGDSRAYRIADGKISQLTRDHSWVAERVAKGEITPEEAKTHKKKNVITRSVGIRSNVKADIDVLTLRPPERFLLCSDGLCGVVAEKDILEFAQQPDLKTACDGMVELAKKRGGKDNITAVLVNLSLHSKSKKEQKEEISDEDDFTEPPM